MQQISNVSIDPIRETVTTGDTIYANYYHMLIPPNTTLWIDIVAKFGQAERTQTLISELIQLPSGVSDKSQ